MFEISLRDDDPISVSFENTVYRGEPNLQEKTVTPTKEEQRVTYDAEYDGLEAVTVEGYTVALQKKTVEPLTVEQTITPDEDFEGLEKVTVEAVTSDIDENIKAENIKAGVSVLGVEGTAQAMTFSADGRLDVETLILPDTVTSIGAYEYYFSIIKNFVLPNTVETIKEYAFAGINNCTDFTIPQGVKTLVHHSFDTCQNLVSISLPDTLETMEQWCFRNLFKVKSLTIPKSVKTMGQGCITYCYALETLIFEGIDIILDSPALFLANCSKLKRVEVPKGWNTDLYIQWSTLFEAEVLENIIDNLADLTGLTAKTLSIGATNYEKLSEEYKQKIINKNWIQK